MELEKIRNGNYNDVNNKLKDFDENIEAIRKKLNKEVLKSKEIKNNQKILKLSKELDELIVKYLKSTQEK